MKLLDGIGEMQLGHYRDNTIDAFGDAYEYLMRMYASNAGKSGGEYYTPQEVSELLTRLTVIGKARVNKVYDKSITRLIHSRDRGKGLKSPIFGGFSFCWDKAVEMKFGVGEETSSSYAHTLKR